jgi:hypothetical protein
MLFDSSFFSPSSRVYVVFYLFDLSPVFVVVAVVVVACMSACLHVCMPACLHACMPACLHACMPANLLYPTYYFITVLSWRNKNMTRIK